MTGRETSDSGVRRDRRRSLPRLRSIYRLHSFALTPPPAGLVPRSEFRPLVRLLSSPFLRGTVMANKLETQSARDGCRLDKLDRDWIAKTVSDRAADESAAGFVEAEIFVADIARRNETIGTGFVELDKQAGAGDTGNVATEGGADAIGEEVRNQ